MDKLSNKEKFVQLIQDNRGIIFKICHSYCRNTSDHEDLAQEIIYQLWRSWHNYKTTCKFSTWMYRVALNTAISFYRKEKKETPVTQLTEQLINIKEPEIPPEKEQHILLLQQFISELKELDKALILLYLEEKSHKEIAEIIGITETNVATKIGRIKMFLKQRFSQITM
ncbi:MAG: sigma-70 family RNA polymerase sigma factor [Chitinophagaceae bacterium]